MAACRKDTWRGNKRVSSPSHSSLLNSQPRCAACSMPVIPKALENSSNQQKQIVSTARRKRVALNPFLGESAAIKRLADTAAKIAKSHSPVLIQGETGAGKGVLANWMHENGPRADEA